MITLTFDSRQYDFEEQPSMPLKGAGQVWTQGWDIPTNWAIDGFNQCWMNDAHGGYLAKSEPDLLLSEASYSPDIEAEMRQLLGRKPKLPSWITSARNAGWIPPADWDESVYDKE